MTEEKKKIIELRAKHPTASVQIIERFIDGVRFMKVTPRSMMPMVMERIKKMFEGKDVTFEESETGWLRIEKQKRDSEMEKAVEKLGVKLGEEMNERYILEQEAKMLEKQGFIVKIREFE